MTIRQLAVVSAGLNSPSSSRLLADRLTQATTNHALTTGATLQTSVFELRDLAHQITDNLLTGFAPPPLEDAIGTIISADGLIVVSPIFSASFSGLFKSFFDVLDPEALSGMPVLLGATGGSQRHSLSLEHAMRPLFSYLRTITVPTAVYAATQDWGEAEGGSYLMSRIEKAGDELGELILSRPSRGRSSEEDPFADLIPFAEQLAKQ